MNKFQRTAFTYATIVALGGFIFGLDAALISGTVNFISAEFGLTDLQLGMAVGAPGLGVIFALPFASYACNDLGRKRTLQIIALLYVVSAVASTLAPNYWSLVGARFLGGLAFSSISLSSMYIGEISPPAWRGKLVSMNQINIVLGLSCAYFLNYLILDLAAEPWVWVEDWGISTHTWRWMLAMEIFPAIVWLLLLSFIPLSPAWLVYKGREAEARQTLQKLLPEAEVDAQLADMQLSMEEVADDRSTMAQMRDIFSKPLRVTLIIAVTIAIVQQATGINAIMFYAPKVIEQLGLGTDAAFQQAIWFGLTSIVFTVLALLLIDKIGRKPMIIGGLVWIMISLGVCSYGFSQARYTLTEQDLSEMTDLPNAQRLSGMVGTEYQSDTQYKTALAESLGEAEARDFSSMLLQKAADLPGTLILLGILSFIAAFHFSVGPIMWVLFSEIFPIGLRGVAIPFFALITSVTSYLVQQFFPWQLATMGGSSIFLFYALMVGIGLVILSRYLVETKNMTIEEIQEKLIRK